MPLLRLSHQWRSLSFTEYLRVIEKVLCCLGGLHSRGEVHGDLCPDTIGVSMSPLEVCLGEPLKLTTPGQQFSTCNSGNSVFFDPYWAPELKTLRNLSPSSDIYAIGSTVLEWINNGPLESPTPEDSSDSKVISVTKILEKRDFTMPQYFMSMLDLCFRLNPQERPTWSQLRNAIRKYIVELVLDHHDARNFWSRCCLWSDVYKALAFLTGRHYRTGQNSLVQLLPSHLLQTVIDFAFPQMQTYWFSVPVEAIVHEIALGVGRDPSTLRQLMGLHSGSSQLYESPNVPVDFKKEVTTLDRFALLVKLFGDYYCLPSGPAVIDELLTVMSEPYFMYDMPREQVEQVLMPYQTGAFLVRFSIHCTREAPFVLSFRGTYPRHTRIYWQLGSPGYSTTISAAVGQESAPTLQGLITKLHARGVLTTPFKGERIHTTGYYSD